jgi:hypothetical protein
VDGSGGLDLRAEDSKPILRRRLLALQTHQTRHLGLRNGIILKTGGAKARRIELAAISVDAVRRDKTPGCPIPRWAQSRLDRVRKGSLKAMVAAKCANCMAFQRGEIRLCTVVSCPLWAIRPYQTAEFTEEQTARFKRHGVAV